MSATLDPKLRNGIGASEIAMLFGYSPYGGPLALYMRLVHPEQRDATDDQDRGIRAEPLIAERYARDHYLFHQPDLAIASTTTGGWLCEVPTQRHPVHDFLIASPDRAVVRDCVLARVVECKTAADGKGWENPDDVPDGVPFGYLLQCQQQLACGVEINGERQFTDDATIAACVRHFRDYREYPIRRSAKIEAAIIERAGSFWHDNVLPKRPPDFDGSAAGDALLKLLYPADARPVLLKASATADAVAFRLRDAQARADDWQAKADTEKQILKAIVADSAGMEGDSWRCTWKKNRPSQSVDWEAVARSLGADAARIAQHTTEKSGARVFRTHWSDK